jgi:hypothetical protein
VQKSLNNKDSKNSRKHTSFPPEEQTISSQLVYCVANSRIYLADRLIKTNKNILHSYLHLIFCWHIFALSDILESIDNKEMTFVGFVVN